MKKKQLLLIFILVTLLFFGAYYFSNKPKGESVKGQTATKSQCEFSQVIYYYLDQCQWCQKIKNEGTLSKLEQLGLRLKKLTSPLAPFAISFKEYQLLS